MAKLTVPHRAIGYKRRGTGRNSNVWKMRAKDKYHLLRGDADPSGEGMTVCNRIVWGPDMFKPGEPYEDFNREDAYDIPEISAIPAERICKKCLGPLHAED